MIIVNYFNQFIIVYHKYLYYVLIGQSVDLMFFTLLNCVYKGISIDELFEEFERRHK